MTLSTFKAPPFVSVPTKADASVQQAIRQINLILKNLSDRLDTLTPTISTIQTQVESIPLTTTPPYSISGATKTRAYNAASVTVNQLATTLGTLVADLTSAGVLG